LTALVLQVIFEFAPLWLVALAAPAVLYGPYWAALISRLGLGGLLAGKVPLNRVVPLSGTVGLMIFASLVLTRETGVGVVTIAQVVLALLIVLANIHITRLLHDAVSSTVRSGVASGVGALSWIVFLPSALIFGIVSKQTGAHTASWIIVAAAGGVCHFACRNGHRSPRQAHDRGAGGGHGNTLQ
jgi:hypothetical protein